MNSDEVLSACRRLAKRIKEKNTPEQIALFAEELAINFSALDAHLVIGGELPTSWREHEAIGRGSGTDALGEKSICAVSE